jgi:5'-3' exonuclease
MGVDGLYKFISVNCPYVYKSVFIKNINKKACIVDGIQHIYSQLIYMRTRNKEVYTSDGKNISHIHGLINSLSYYLKNGIIPIFIFDGKPPQIKKKKIEERKLILRNNLKKLKNLENVLNDYNKIKSDDDKNCDEFNKYFFGTPPESILKMNDKSDGDISDSTIDDSDEPEQTLDDSDGPEREIGYNDDNIKMSKKINRLNNEYYKIYKKSIILKDYYVKDWIEILELLGLPYIQAENEADPVCSYLLKNNKNIYGIISDDSDMLIFGANRLLRKIVNQHFKIIELDYLIETINYDLLHFEDDAGFTFDDLVNFCILLGTDYGSFNLKIKYDNSLDLLKYYYKVNKDILQIINENDLVKFTEIKNYYTTIPSIKKTIIPNESLYGYIDPKLFHSKPEWNKPKLMELKKRLLELDVDEDYIDETKSHFDDCYTSYNNNKNYVYHQKFTFYNYNKEFHYNNFYK